MKMVVNFNFRTTIPDEYIIKNSSIDYEKMIKKEFISHMSKFIEENFDRIPILKSTFVEPFRHGKDIRFELIIIDPNELRRLREIEHNYNKFIYYK